MNRISFVTRAIAAGSLAVVVAALTGCTMKNQDAPPLTGPSGLGTTVSLSVSPDVLPQDGASQSIVTIRAFDSNGNPLRNLSLSTEIRVGGVRTDFGSLSARNLVTDTRGMATLVYTAPASPAGPSVDTGTTVNIAVIPIGGDFANEVPRQVTIRLIPTGVVVPPDGLQPAFTFTPPAPNDHEVVIFDATASVAPANNPIATYTWDFGDGRVGSGAQTQHAYDTPGLYNVTLTITDGFGRSRSTSKTVTVGAGIIPIVSFVTSPASPLIGQAVNFNASASKAAPGRTIRSYVWDFGDGGQSTTGTALTTHSYTAAGAYVVTLVVTDDAGRFATATQTVTVVASTPTAQFTFSPNAATAPATINFNGSSSTASPGRTLVTYAWDFGDGTPAQSGSSPQISHGYTTAGTYTVTLTVTDDALKTSSKSQPVTLK
jgi:PKD repeat protein